MSYFRTGGFNAFSRPTFFGGFSVFPPVIKALLISNVAIWLFVDFLLYPFTIAGTQIGGSGGLISYYFALWPLGANFWPWQLLTYMFMHGGFLHLFFNMLALWMFGMELENTWGSRKFAVYYLLCGLGAGLSNLIIAPMVGQGAPTVGASGAVFGVLIAFGMMFPDRPIYIYFLLPIKAKYFIAVYIGMELYYGVTGLTDGVAHFAHLGGAAVGFVYMLGDLGLIPVRTWWSDLRSQGAGTLAGGQGVRRRGSSESDVHDATFYDIKSGKPYDGDGELNQEVIDEILDKISKSGYQSLTEAEKRLLNEASKKIH